MRVGLLILAAQFRWIEVRARRLDRCGTLASVARPQSEWNTVANISLPKLRVSASYARPYATGKVDRREPIHYGEPTNQFTGFPAEGRPCAK